MGAATTSTGMNPRQPRGQLAGPSQTQDIEISWLPKKGIHSGQLAGDWCLCQLLSPALEPVCPDQESARGWGKFYVRAWSWHCFIPWCGCSQGSGGERGSEKNPSMKKQINHPIYTKFAKIAGKSAGADLDVVFHFISTVLGAAIHSSSLNPTSRVHPAGSWEEGACRCGRASQPAFPTPQQGQLGDLARRE